MYSRKYAEWMWLQINHLDTIHFIRIKVITVEQTISINILNKKIIWYTEFSFKLSRQNLCKVLQHSRKLSVWMEKALQLKKKKTRNKKPIKDFFSLSWSNFRTLFLFEYTYKCCIYTKPRLQCSFGTYLTFSNIYTGF